MGRAFFDVKTLSIMKRKRSKDAIKQMKKRRKEIIIPGFLTWNRVHLQGSFTPLVFPITGEMRRKSWMLVKCQLTTTK